MLSEETELTQTLEQQKFSSKPRTTLVTIGGLSNKEQMDRKR